MNTATQAARFQAAEQVTVQDTRRVFGYHGGVPHMTMDNRDSGLDSNPIRGGSLLLFIPGVHYHRGMFDPLKGRYPRHALKVMPNEFAQAVDNKFHLNEDFSYRTLTPLTELQYSVTEEGYTDEAYAYFDVLHPAITCPFGLETDVISNTGGNVGSNWYQACPTCRLADLESDECSQRIFAAANTMDSNVLAETRELLKESCRTAIDFVTRKVNDIEGDMTLRRSGQNGRAVRNEVDHVHLRMLHKTVNADTVNTNAEASGNAIADAITKRFESQQRVEVESEEVLRMKLELAQARQRTAELEAEKARWDASNRDLAEAAEVESVSETGGLEPLPVNAEVFVDGMAAIVTSKHGGKYKVTFGDGSTRMCGRDELREAKNADSTE